MLKLSLITILLGCGVVCAHEEPHDVIHALTHQLEHAQVDAKADLYYQRAMEYRAAGQKGKAQDDLLRYTELVPEDALGWLELGRVQDEGRKSLEHLNKALELANSDAEKSLCNDALAKHFYDIKEYGKSLSYCESSILLGEQKSLTPLLFKAHLLWMLGRVAERADFLADARKLNPSVVLENAWVDGMIDAGRGDEVLDYIMKQIADSRFKSSWYIRAARCEVKDAWKRKAYALAAIEEIKLRLNARRPDVTLLMDLVHACLIAEHHDEALRYLKIAKAQNYNPWAMARLEKEVIRVEPNHN